eukprot:9470873-Pyramimonas_sp.AAC.1
MPSLCDVVARKKRCSSSSCRGLHPRGSAFGAPHGARCTCRHASGCKARGRVIIQRRAREGHKGALLIKRTLSGARGGGGLVALRQSCCVPGPPTYS